MKSIRQGQVCKRGQVGRYEYTKVISWKKGEKYVGVEVRRGGGKASGKVSVAVIEGREGERREWKEVKS